MISTKSSQRTLFYTLLVHLVMMTGNAFSPTPMFSLSKSLHDKQNVIDRMYSIQISMSSKNEEEEDINDEAAQLKKKAEELRLEAQNLEKNLNRKPRPNQKTSDSESTLTMEEEELSNMSLRNKRILVVGANGRLGSMVCRYLLRTYPQIKEVIAAVHTVSENSITSRGYGRLSYEVGAEDGRGSIGAAWSAEDRVATFEYTPEMENYNLQKLRLLEVELLDPVQCQTITEDVDCVIFCATDFNGNKPRAISGLNVAFLFRALAAPTKGRVEIEGLRNLLEGLTLSKQAQLRRSSLTTPIRPSTSKNPTSFILVSTADQAYPDFETPFGSFKSIKREGESILENEFPSLSKCILQMSKYDENFVDENLDVQYDKILNKNNLDALEDIDDEKRKRRINRRDAARFTVDALIDENLVDQKVEVWTALR